MSYDFQQKSDYHMVNDDADPVSRRTVLRMGTMAAGTATLGFAASGTARQGGDNGGDNGGGGKSGGRGQTSDEVRLDAPFTVELNGPVTRNASCHSDQSADQQYNEYEFTYCDTGEGGTFCVIPDDSDVDEDRVYEFRSTQACKSNSGFTTRFSFGPSNSEHDC